MFVHKNLFRKSEHEKQTSGIGNKKRHIKNESS
jgi:hypothetical protein